MAAGWNFETIPDEEEEHYDVSSGRRRRGPFVLDVSTLGLPINSYVPSFTPICADLVKHTAQIVVNAKVVEAATADATSIKIAKGSYVVSGAILGNGSAGATVSAINKTNADYDVLTLAAAFGATLAVGDVLFTAKTAAGKTQAVVANSALYENHKVTSGINNVALLMKAFDIEPDKLVTPFSANDKANLPYFQFNE